MNSFRQLNVYVKAKKLVARVYQLLKKFPREEQFALCDQLRRAAVSIPSNIAEGCGRETQKEQTHFLNIAYGSLMEIYSQLDVACDLGYITNQEFEQMEVMVNEEAKMLAGMIKKRKEDAAKPL